jgi:hypothetical protein
MVSQETCRMLLTLLAPFNLASSSLLQRVSEDGLGHVPTACTCKRETLHGKIANAHHPLHRIHVELAGRGAQQDKHIKVEV